MSVAAARTGDGLLERDASVARLQRLLDDVCSGSGGRLLLVAGEAGVGKTALLRAFCETLDVSVRSMWGACDPLRTPRPLGPLWDIAEASGGELAELVASGARPHGIVAALLRELEGPSPTVLVLEDVHWADEATLDVLTLLAPRIAPAPALVLATYRDDELGHADQLRVVLGELVRAVERLRVEPLSPAAVTELARPYGVDGGELHNRTGGNAFFVTEALAAGNERIPATVRDAVLARATRLSRAARRLLDAASVVPGQAEIWLLEALAGELTDHIDECLASGVLRAGPAHVAFRHELGRLTIEEAISPNRRVALHRRAGAALVAHGADDPDFARLAHHADAAGDGDAAVRWAPLAAARAASSGAHREAAEHYACALRFGDRLSLERRADLLQRRADECFMTGELGHAIEALEAALAAHRRRGDVPGEASALRSLSRLLRYVGRTSDARAAGFAAVELLERLPPGRELALALGSVAYLFGAAEQADEALAWGTRALQLARSLDDTEALIYALTEISVVHFRAEEPGAHAELDHALELSHRHGLEEHAGRLFANFVVWSVRQRRFSIAAQYLPVGLEYCSTRGLDMWRLFLQACGARLKLDVGRWSDAAESAALVLRDPRRLPPARGWALSALGVLRARRGDPEWAVPIDEARTLADSTDEIQRIGPAAAAAAEAAWLAGDGAAVDTATREALELALRRDSPWVAGEIAYWRWQAGLRDELPAGALAEPFRLSIEGSWAQAASLWTTLGCPYERALAFADSGGTELVRGAIDELNKLGAEPAAAIVARRLRERGVRGVPRGPRRRTRENPAGLTLRELEVLALLADGLRNAEIAQRLVVSPKTIDHHVSAVMRKLGAHTRGEAAAEAARLGLGRPSDGPPGRRR